MGFAPHRGDRATRCPDKRESWHGGADLPIFGPVSKNNTGMAALRAGLPVITC